MAAIKGFFSFVWSLVVLTFLFTCIFISCFVAMFIAMKVVILLGFGTAEEKAQSRHQLRECVSKNQTRIAKLFRKAEKSDKSTHVGADEVVVIK
jgi:hypothetical protein